MELLNTARGWFIDKGLVRAQSGKLLLGVCAGIGRKFGVSPWVVRLAFVLVCLIPGPQFLVYFALALLMPGGTIE